MLATSNTAVTFLQWTAAGTAVQGSLTEVYVTDASPYIPQNDVVDFTGTIAGGSISLALVNGQSLTGSSTLIGSFRGSDLDLTYPASGGTIATLTFSPATVSDYNAAVTRFDNAEAALLAAEQAAQAAAEAQASAAAADAATRSCDLQVQGHDAQVVAEGDGALAECRSILSVFTFPDSAEWAPIVNPAPLELTGVSIVCGGYIGALNLVVWDSGGQYYGGLLCAGLPIVQAFIGINDDTPSGGGLRLIGYTDSYGTIQPAIVPGSPAARAGLRANDIIMTIDGNAMATDDDLAHFLAFAHVGQSIQLTVLRGGKTIEVDLTLARRPKE